jgi:hypothetical protein
MGLWRKETPTARDPAVIVGKWREGEDLSLDEQADLPLALSLLMLAELEHICEALGGREQEPGRG